MVCQKLETFRRRRYASEDEEQSISTWKMGVVFGVIVLCFAMLYPTLFHPFISSFFSKTTPPTSQMPNRPPIHPSMAGAQRNRPEMHPHPHPGLLILPRLGFLLSFFSCIISLAGISFTASSQNFTVLRKYNFKKLPSVF